MKNWFITGASSGLGAALAKSVIERGDFAVATFRSQQQADTFTANSAGKGLGVLLDITDAQQIQATIETVERKHQIDVLVNNAGVGFAGAVEETSLAEVRSVFETNFFGQFNVTNAVLPYMRQRKAGHILQISSHGGVKAFAGFGIYNASKFALEGMSEALAQELAPLGIHLHIIEPGPFRTNFAGNGFGLAATLIDDYAPTAGVFRERIKGVDGKQEGDPAKAAAAILNLVANPVPNLRMPLGKTALMTIGLKASSLQQDLDFHRATAENAVFA
jgi:NAD(P)-dependent dehydrogenase (short-subunit alcohol dehydrogenase family)